MGSGAAGTDREIELLRAQADTMMAQLQAITSRISEIQQNRSASVAEVTGSEPRGQTSRKPRSAPPVATVDKERCVVCGTCADVCPEEAITTSDITVIDPQRCNGCGICVDECPNDALSLT
jgi:ferredoxin